MASKNLTFDPNAGVPYAANLALYSGADFKATFNVVDTSDVAYDFQGLTTTSVWTGSSQMQKSAGIGATTIPSGTFTVGFTSAGGGIFEVSMGSTTWLCHLYYTSTIFRVRKQFQHGLKCFHLLCYKLLLLNLLKHYIHIYLQTNLL